MLSSVDIKSVKFSKAINGYKQDEVDVLLDKVEADYIKFERLIKEYQAKIDNLSKEIEDYKKSQNSIQNVLLNAQKLADQIVDEAKVKSAQIVKEAEENIEKISFREKELSEMFEKKATERKAALEREIAATINAAEQKAASIIAAAEDSVKRQQTLFDRLRLEISAFKVDVTQKYKEHLVLLQSLPDAVPMSPERIAESVSAILDKVPDPASFIKEAPEDAQDSSEVEENTTQNSGFVVNEDISENTESE